MKFSGKSIDNIKCFFILGDYEHIVNCFKCVMLNANAPKHFLNGRNNSDDLKNQILASQFNSNV